MAEAQLPLIESPKYEIRTVADFLKVPERRRAVCLKEFGTWLKIHDHLMVILTPPEHPGCVRFDRFTWIDDGKSEMSITLESTPSADAVDPQGGTAPA